MLKRFYAVFIARNYEFFRDRAALGWNLLFPILLVVGFAVIFNGDQKALYKVGVVGEAGAVSNPLTEIKHIEFVFYQEKETALFKIRQHKLDMLLEPSTHTYWVNKTSPNGYMLEQLISRNAAQYKKEALEGKEIRYLDWVVPGILAMNMMFSCLFGVGYVIVRYRKNSVLKRLSATPLRPIEFLSAQIISRMLIVLVLSGSIFVACHWMFDFYFLGSAWTLLLVTALGAFSLVALSLLIACRSESEEFIGGMLNLTSWPMMVLSGVWFSLEGSPEYIQAIANLLPLTHMLEAARAVMLDGAELADISDHLAVLSIQSALFLALGALFFKWQGTAR